MLSFSYVAVHILARTVICLGRPKPRPEDGQSIGSLFSLSGTTDEPVPVFWLLGLVFIRRFFHTHNQTQPHNHASS